MADRCFRPVCESEVTDIWQQRALAGAVMRDSDGKFLTVVYPGRPNDGHGGDFRDAVILSAEGLLRGCIEIHTLTSGWQSHGHHLDPAYNEVVLQVAWKADRGMPARAACGRVVPTVLLEEGQPGTGADLESAGLPCQKSLARKGVNRSEEFIDMAGEQRFLLKSRLFQNEMAVLTPEQILFRGLSRSLGYSRNMSAFADFSERLPLSAIYRDLDLGALSDLTQIQAYLAGKAGLLFYQRGLTIQTDNYLRALEKIWSESGRQALSPAPIWEFYRVRPGNHPLRRLMSLGHWLQQSLFNQWPEKFLTPVRDMPPRESLSILNSNLRAADNPSRSQHFDCSLASMLTQSARVGAARTQEMIVNVILPFILAWANLNGDRHVADKAMRIYRAHPALAVNSIQRHMSKQLGLGPRELKSACRQQGLLQIYKTLCTQGLCRECALAQ